MISECEYSSCSCMLSKSESLSSLLQSSSLWKKNNKKENGQCRSVIFCFKITGFSILEFSVFGVCSYMLEFTRFWKKWVIPFWNFPFFGCVDIPCYLLRLFIHVQYVTDITASYGGFGLCAVGFVWFFVFGSG